MSIFDWNFKDELIYDFSNEICSNIAQYTMKELQSLKGDCLLFNDSRLRNVWDEICVQIQGEYSFYWDAYVATIESIIRQKVESLKAYEKMAVWWNTKDPADTYDDEEKNLQYNAYNIESICEYIEREYVENLAMNYTNSLIESYLYNYYEEDEEDNNDVDDECLDDEYDSNNTSLLESSFPQILEFIDKFLNEYLKQLMVDENSAEEFCSNYILDQLNSFCKGEPILNSIEFGFSKEFEDGGRSSIGFNLVDDGDISYFEIVVGQCTHSSDIVSDSSYETIYYIDDTGYEKMNNYNFLDTIKDFVKMYIRDKVDMNFNYRQ